MLGYHLPPGADNPQTRHPPDQAAPPPRSRHPHGAEHAGRYGQHVGGMHPNGMQSCYFKSFGDNKQELTAEYLYKFCVMKITKTNSISSL